MKVLRRVIIVLVAIEVLYVVAGTALLNSSVGTDFVNRKPEKVWGQWDRAWTVLPGLVTVQGARFRGQSKGWQWYVQADSVTALVHLIPLSRKRVIGRWARAHGLSLWLRRRRDEPLAPEQAALVPEIPGLTNPPDPDPEVLYPSNPDSKPWRITLDRAELVDAREIWIEVIRLRGTGQGDGRALGFETKGGPISGEYVDIAFRDGSLLIGEQNLGTDLAIALDISVEPFRAKGIQLSELIGGVSGSVEFQGRVPDLGVLTALLGDLPSISLGGHGETQMRLSLDHGRLLPGTELQVEGEALEARYLNYVARGEGSIRGQVEDGKVEPQAELSLGLENFALGWQDDPPYVEGTGFRMVATGPSPDLSNPDRRRPEVMIDLPPSTITDFAQYNRYLPPGLGLAFVEGSAQVSSHFELSAEDKSVSGRLGFAAPHVVASFKDARVAGSVQLESVLADGHLDTRRFRGEGTRLELKGIDMRDGDGKEKVSDWWARMHLRGGRLDLKTIPVIHGQVHLELRDSSPLGVLLGQRSSKLGWLANAMEVKDVTAVTQVSGTKDALHIRELELEGDKLQVRSDVTVVDGKAHGIFYTKFKALRVGATLKGDGRDWKFIRPGKWYDTQLNTRRQNRGTPRP